MNNMQSVENIPKIQLIDTKKLEKGKQYFITYTLPNLTNIVLNPKSNDYAYQLEKIKQNFFYAGTFLGSEINGDRVYKFVNHGKYISLNSVNDRKRLYSIKVEDLCKYGLTDFCNQQMGLLSGGRTKRKYRSKRSRKYKY